MAEASAAHDTRGAGPRRPRLRDSIARPTSAHDTVGPVGIADRIARTLRPLAGGGLPVRLRCWDGSESGPTEGPLVELRSPRALRRLLWHPGELGAAQAYVTGELDVLPADAAGLDAALAQVWSVVGARGLVSPTARPAVLAGALAGLLGTAVRVGAVGRPPAAPPTQARVGGRLHSLPRDRQAISHHYDLSNDFYRLVLDETMAYSCAYWTDRRPGYGLGHAQRDKLSLACRKLALQPGMHLLDIGCGWGALSLHAAEQFGARVTGVTISAQQKRLVDERITARGLTDRVQIRLQDYREVRGEFDAVGSLEMGEHVGRANYPAYVGVLQRSVRPGGRVLVQQMSRPGRHGGDHPGGGPFIESFIAPDMHMRPVGETLAMMEAGGLEVRDVHSLREHYVRTVDAWVERFEQHQQELSTLVPEEVLRVWRLYLVGGRMAFRDGRMGVDQILAVRPGGASIQPQLRDW